MKKLIAFFLVVSLPLWGVEFKEVTIKSLQKRGEHGNQLYYLSNQEVPFTGKAVAHRPDGRKMTEISYKDGKLHGLKSDWDESGKKLTEISYKDGKLHGLWTSWNESGKKLSETNFKDGQLHGLLSMWYENGQKRGEGNYTDDKMVGLWTFWYENGHKQSEQNWNEGQIWDAVAWKPNGEKCSRTNLKNGNGFLFFYFENGNPMTEEKRKSGNLEGTLRIWHENGQKSIERIYENGKLMSFKHWKASGEEFSAVDYGKKIYNSNCVSCHLTNGLGVSTIFPPLSGSKWVSSDPGIICKILINGIKGEMVVNGKKYGSKNLTPCLPKNLTDREIAHVVTYVRQAWSNSAPEVTEKQVTRYRRESESKKGFWTAKELTNLYPQLLAEKRE